MCQFASFVLTKDRCFYLPDSESHSEIIRHFEIHESGARGLNVVKVEILPPDGAIRLDNLAKWTLRFDQDQFPEWHEAKASEARARKYLLDKLKNLTTLNASNTAIKDVSGLKNLTTLYACA